MASVDESVGARGVALIQDLERFIGERHVAAATQAARNAVGSGQLSIPQLYALVLVPLMKLTGARWQAGDEEVWEEHYTTAAVRTIVESLFDEVAARSAEAKPTGKTVLLACPEEEYHDLGLRMLSDRFSLAGYHAHFLGAALPLEQLLLATRALKADIVILSASTHFHRVRLREYVDAIHERMPDVQAWVGGPAFARGHSDWSDDEVPDIDAILGDLRAV